MKKNTYRTPSGFKEVKCSCCNQVTMKIDNNSISGTCFKCVSKSMSPNSVILTDLNTEDYRDFIQKKIKIWKIREQLN